MPRKRKSSLSRSTSDAKRMRSVRNNENDSERQLRLTQNAIRNASQRADMSPAEREIRLAADNQRHISRRQRETFEERLMRLAADRQRHMFRRQRESSEERLIRLAANSQRNIFRRQRETPEEREMRLAADRERHIVRRQQQSTGERGSRLSADRACHTFLREAEPQLRRFAYLERDRVCHVEFKAATILDPGHSDTSEEQARVRWTNKQFSGGIGAVQEIRTFKGTGMPSSVTTKSKNLSFIHHRKKKRAICESSKYNEELDTEIEMEYVKIEESTNCTEEDIEIMPVKEEPEDNVYPSYEFVSSQGNEDQKFDATKLNNSLYTDKQKTEYFRATIRKKQKTAQSPSHEPAIVCAKNPEAPSTSMVAETGDSVTIKEELTEDDSESAGKLTLVGELKKPEHIQGMNIAGRSSIAHSSSCIPKPPDTTVTVGPEMEHEFVSLGTWTEVTISDSEQEMDDEPHTESILGTVEDDIQIVQESRDVPQVLPIAHRNSLYPSEQVEQVLPTLDESSIYPPEQVAQVLPIVDPSSLYGSDAFGPCTDDLYVVPAGSSNSEQVTGSLENLSGAREYDSENVGQPTEILGEIRCDLCSEWFDGMDSLIIHALTHHSLDQSQCTTQNESTQADVPEKTYKCGSCRKTYKQLRNYKKHMELHDDERHKCNVCQKIFVRQSYLVKHRLIHTPEKQHECNTCNQTFSSEAEMFSHMTDHTDEVETT